jgi:poly-gamma-glutamate synthesis protein (capsule biosynthesis protein)
MAVDVRDPAAAEQLLAQGAGVLDYELPLTFRLGRVPCVLGETAGVRHRIHAEDLRDTLWNVRLGKQHADLLIVSHHCHDGDLASGDPVDYQRDLAHQVVDAGADVYVAQGTHRLMSLEVYRGKPIFYGLGNFFWSDIQEPVCADIYDRHADKLRTADLDSNQATDADLNALLNAASFAGVDGINPVFESAFVECRFARGRISQIRVIPLDLGYGKRLTRSGIPRWACAATGRRILDRLQAGCASLGTHLRIKNGIGLVELESQGVQAAGSGIEGHDSGRATVGTQNKEKPK